MIYEKNAKWTFEEGIKPSWGHHKIPMHEPYDFICARGGARTGEKKLYAFKRTPAYMEFLKSKGNTQVWFNWWKGMGRQHEARYQEDVINLLPVCKDLGLRAILYVSLGSLTLDTLLLEEPDAEDWVAKTQSGQGASCQVTHQCFRRRPCYTSEGYLHYMEKMLSDAMRLGFDGIHFDNIGMQAEPESCHCDRCLQKFRAYLQSEYGDEKGLEIFGWNDFSKTNIPWFNQHNIANKLFELKVPIQRAWVDFKVKVYADASKRLFAAIRKIKKDAFIEMNAVESDGFASAFWRAVDYSELFPHLEMVCDEANGFDKLSAKGTILSGIRAKKWANSYGCAHNAGKSIRQQALNFSDDRSFFTCDKVFWDKYKSYQLGSVSNAQVAVLRETYSMRYNRVDPLMDTLCMEEFLIQNQIPFDLIGNDHLDHLDTRIKILVIAGMQIISDELASKITDWVKGGGRVLLAGSVGLYNEHYLLRTKEIEEIKDFTDFDLAESAQNAFSAMIGDDPYVSKENHFSTSYGQGLVSFIPRLAIDRLAKTPDNWVIPKEAVSVPQNKEVLDSALSFLFAKDRSLVVKTDQKVYVHDKIVEGGKERILHFMNFNYPEEATVKVSVKDLSLSEMDFEECVELSLDDATTGYPKNKIKLIQEECGFSFYLFGMKNHSSVILKKRTFSNTLKGN